MKSLRVILFIITGLYLAVLIVAFLLQDRLIFFPRPLDKDYRFSLTSEDEEVFITTTDGNTINGLLYKRPGNKNVVLYFHGNGGSLDMWQTASDKILPLGCDLLIIDYRGYGKSTGTFSESGFYDDAHSAYKFLLQNGYRPDQVVVCGRSLGTGIATELASTEQVKALVLISPYTSLANIATERMPYLLPGLLIKYRLNTLKIIENVKVPVLVIHGTNDISIPYAHGQKVYEAIKAPKKLVSIEGAGHSNLDDYTELNKGALEFIGSLPE